MPVVLTQSTPIQIALNTLMRNAGLGEKDSPRVTRKKRADRGDGVVVEGKREMENVNMAAQANDRRRTQEL